MSPDSLQARTLLGGSGYDFLGHVERITNRIHLVEVVTTDEPAQEHNYWQIIRPFLLFDDQPAARLELVAVGKLAREAATSSSDESTDSIGRAVIPPPAVTSAV